MPEMGNFKRKRANRSSYVVNPDGNCTPSDSESDEDDRMIHRKIVRRRESQGDDVVEVDAEMSSNSNSNASVNGSDSSSSQPGNSQLLYAALQKIQELEHELAELNEADYDSGNHDDDDEEEEEIDEGNASDFDDGIDRNQSQHEHRDEILDGQAEALGFAFCVKETFEYLAAQGITPDNPVVSTLRQRFLGQCNRIPFP